MLPKHKGKVVLIALAVGVVALILVPSSKKIPLRNGYARVTKAPFARSLFPEAHSTIAYHPDHGQEGSIVLWQDAFDGPAMLMMSATDTNVLLCLYDYDTCFRLLRIHTDRPFKPLPPSDDLNRILFTCTWEIESGTTSWGEVEDHLRRVSPVDFAGETVTVGIRAPNSASNLLTTLTRSGGKYPW